MNGEIGSVATVSTGRMEEFLGGRGEFCGCGRGIGRQVVRICPEKFRFGGIWGCLERNCECGSGFVSLCPGGRRRSWRVPLAVGAGVSAVDRIRTGVLWRIRVLGGMLRGAQLGWRRRFRGVGGADPLCPPPSRGQALRDLSPRRGGRGELAASDPRLRRALQHPRSERFVILANARIHVSLDTPHGFPRSRE